MTTIVFPGQGSQSLGMSRDFYENFQMARETFELIEDVSKIKIKEIIFENQSNLLNITKYTQLAIFCSSMSIYNVLKSEVDLSKINIKFMLGHSLGEYSALTASNVISLKNSTNLLKTRGDLMDKAYDTNKSGMAAIIGLPCLSIEKIIQDNKLNIEIANDNSPMQIVVSGINKNLENSKDFFISNGAKKFLTLNVSAAFHSKIMKEAEKKMSIHINNTSFNDSSISIISNYSAKKSANKSEENIIEIGPGKILTGLINRISSKFHIINLDNINNFKKFINEL